MVMAMAEFQVPQFPNLLASYCQLLTLCEIPLVHSRLWELIPKWMLISPTTTIPSCLRLSFLFILYSVPRQWLPPFYLSAHLFILLPRLFCHWFLLVHFYALEKEMATHSSVPAWRIPGTGEPGGLPSLGLHRVGHDWSDLAAAAAFSEMNLMQWKKNPRDRGHEETRRFKYLLWFLCSCGGL